MYCHVITRVSWMVRFTYPWGSASALRTLELPPLREIKTTHSDVQDGFPTIALLLVVAVFYNKKYYHLQCNTQGGCVVVLLTTKYHFLAYVAEVI